MSFQGDIPTQINNFDVVAAVETGQPAFGDHVSIRGLSYNDHFFVVNVESVVAVEIMSTRVLS